MPALGDTHNNYDNYHSNRTVVAESHSGLSLWEGGTNMPWYRITIALSGNIEAESREAAEAEALQGIQQELAKKPNDDAKADAKLVSCVEVV